MELLVLEENACNCQFFFLRLVFRVAPLPVQTATAACSHEFNRQLLLGDSCQRTTMDPRERVAKVTRFEIFKRGTCRQPCRGHPDRYLPRPAFHYIWIHLNELESYQYAAISGANMVPGMIITFDRAACLRSATPHL
eukprot:jgi/Botrbrau1/14572/Bobra.27_3s0011.1